MSAHVWEKSYPPGVTWDAALPPPAPVESLLENAAAQWPDRVAIDFYDRTFTFRDALSLAARAAKGFQALGVLIMGSASTRFGLRLPVACGALLCAGFWLWARLRRERIAAALET